MYIQANIGRNMETGPMSERIWGEFQTATMDAIMDAIMEALPESEWPEFLVAANGYHRAGDEYSAFETHTGSGTWDGVTEESAHVSVFFDTRAFRTAPVTRALQTGLEVLAKVWHQEAIAFLVTDSTLAMATE